MQSLRILDRAKEIAKTNQKFNFLAQVIALGKKDREPAYHPQHPETGRRYLAVEANEVSQHIDVVARLSNLAL